VLNPVLPMKYRSTAGMEGHLHMVSLTQIIVLSQITWTQ